ncbi:MAG TPA: hypothetical protein VL098_09600 [Flavipsychrobacter sp.]|nr:hypothetical protein [Flavipsychrobacter sp.]
MHLFVLIMLSVCSYGQDRIDGVWGVKFGENVLNVKNKVYQSQNIQPDYSSAIELTYFDAILNGRKTDRLQLKFYKDQLVSIVITFVTADLDSVYSDYLDISNELISKYGEPTLSNWTIQNGNENEKDSSVINTALLIGDIMASNVWITKNSNEKLNNTRITIQSGGSRKILLVYADSKIETGSEHGNTEGYR